MKMCLFFLPVIVSSGPKMGSLSSSSKLSSIKQGLLFGGSTGGSGAFSTGGGAGCGFKGRVKSLDKFTDLRGGIGGASSSKEMWFRGTGLSLDDTSISGTLLMLVIDEDVDDDPDELPDDDELTIGGGFDDFPLTDVFVVDDPASFSCDGIGVFLFIFGDVCGL
jgi:hypothetical protein